jgi:phosphatidylglycerophosphate synthase
VCIGFGVIRLQTGRVHIQPRFTGKACTAIQLLMVLAMLLWSDLPPLAARLPVWLWYLATVLAVATTFDYLRIGARALGAGRAAPGAFDQDPSRK